MCENPETEHLKTLSDAARAFGARVFERYPDWAHETGTDLAEARDRLTALLLIEAPPG